MILYLEGPRDSTVDDIVRTLRKVIELGYRLEVL